MLITVKYHLSTKCWIFNINVKCKINAKQTIETQIFQTKSITDKVCFTYMTSLMMTIFCMTHVVFVN